MIAGTSAREKRQAMSRLLCRMNRLLACLLATGPLVARAFDVAGPQRSAAALSHVQTVLRSAAVTETVTRFSKLLRISRDAAAAKWIVERFRLRPEIRRDYP
jgi:hypothetical protein